ncbi:MAG: tRNA-uridine aminocarboxypropyltransferase [Vibrio sp.]
MTQISSSRYCPKCNKANNACICDWIQTISSTIKVVVLQHSTEVKRPMGTAKILQLSLTLCEVFVGEDFSDHQELNALLEDPNIEPLVIYPNDQSEPLSQKVQQSPLAKGKQYCLILLDGTWKKAYKMWQLSTNLHSLPCVVLTDDVNGDKLQGNYRIRKAPTDQHLSTVEAGFYALQHLEPQCDFSPLVNAFNHMVDFQIAQMPEGVFERNYGKG